MADVVGGCQLLVGNDVEHCECWNALDTVTGHRDLRCVTTFPFWPKNYLCRFSTVLTVTNNRIVSVTCVICAVLRFCILHLKVLHFFHLHFTLKTVKPFVVSMTFFILCPLLVWLSISIAPFPSIWRRSFDSGIVSVPSCIPWPVCWQQSVSSPVRGNVPFPWECPHYLTSPCSATAFPASATATKWHAHYIQKQPALVLLFFYYCLMLL